VPRIVVFLPSLAGGGAEKVTVATCDGLARRGFDVVLVLGSATGPLAGTVPARVRVRDLGARRTVLAAAGLARVLRQERPDLVISAISHASVVAAAVRRVALPRTPLVVVHHNTTSLSTAGTPRRRDRLIPLLCGLAYRTADRVIAVSHGVADDLARSSRLPRGRIQVLPNPIDYAAIRTRAAAVPEPEPPAGPFVLAVGRLEPQKAFDVLVRALAATGSGARLVILGDGPDRAELVALAHRLGVADRVTFAGFVANPYPWFARAAVLALSSRFEGLPTVLLEALAFPLRIVATDCPSGPAEILAGLDGTELVAVEDVAGLAAALDRALAAGPLGAPRSAWTAYDSPAVLDRICAVVDELTGAGR
jgi:glycosyltransferase involved in cell wall biosynthesis